MQLTSLLGGNLTATDMMFSTANPLLRMLLLADELLRGGGRLLLQRIRLRRLIRIHIDVVVVVVVVVATCVVVVVGFVGIDFHNFRTKI